MKTVLFTFVALLIICGSSAYAGLYTMDFANTTLDLGGASQIDLTNQYLAFGLSFDHIYRYADRRDPWDEKEYGISNGWATDKGLSRPCEKPSTPQRSSATPKASSNSRRHQRSINGTWTMDNVRCCGVAAASFVHSSWTASKKPLTKNRTWRTCY